MSPSMMTLAQEFIQDYIRLKKLAGISERQIRLGAKAASPAAGIAGGFLTGSLLLGVITAVGGYLASNSIARDITAIQVEKIRLKWYEVFAYFSKADMQAFSNTLHEQSPMLWAEISQGKFLPE
jgi:hypothetical protein